MGSFEDFDWEHDERWLAHLRKLELLDPALLAKARAKWYKREIDPEFNYNTPSQEPPPSRAEPSSAAGAARPAVGNGTSNKPAQGRGSSADAWSQAPPSPGGGWTAKLRVALQQAGGPDRLLFIQHVALIVLFLLFLQPFNRQLSRTTYTQFLLVAIITYAAKVVRKFGAPRLKPFPSALKLWLIQAAASTDLQYAIVCCLFMSARPVLLACIPTLVLAAYHAFAYASVHFSHTRLWQQYGRHVYDFLTSKKRDAQLYNAGAEIGLGFLVVLNLLTRERHIMLAICYWQILRTRYHTPDCAAEHRQVWQMADQAARPVFQAVPVLRTPVGFVQRWFNNVR